MWLLAERELGAESAVSGYIASPSPSPSPNPSPNPNPLPPTLTQVSGYIAYLPQPGCASFYDAPLVWGRYRRDIGEM